jgi:uncharacterized protein YbaA (DUF1428 family)
MDACATNPAAARVSIPAAVVRRSPDRPHFRGRPSERRSRMNYIDGFVLAVPTANRETYRRLAQGASAIFKEYGALSMVECWGDDVPEGKLTSFTMAVQRKEDETVVFSWITWPSRTARDEGMKKVMADPRLKDCMDPTLFDAQRMIFGGFQVIVDA